MKRKAFILLTALLIFAGCDTVKRKNYVILIDNSASVPEAIMQRYLGTIQKSILPYLGAEDKLVVQFIDACSQNQAERIFSFDLTDTTFTMPSDGINYQADSSQARLNRYLIGSLTDRLTNVIKNKRKERIRCGKNTDIINAINEAKSLVENRKNYNTQGEKILNNALGDKNFEYETTYVIFSDMIHCTKTLDHTGFGKLRDIDINKMIIGMNETNKIPDLSGIKVFVYGATSTKNSGSFGGKQIENVKLFWEQFFQLAGAELRGYGYDTEIELKNYVVGVK